MAAQVRPSGEVWNVHVMMVDDCDILPPVEMYVLAGGGTMHPDKV